jgi:hypothetical protein
MYPSRIDPQGCDPLAERGDNRSGGRVRDEEVADELPTRLRVIPFLAVGRGLRPEELFDTVAHDFFFAGGLQHIL